MDLVQSFPWDSSFDKSSSNYFYGLTQRNFVARVRYAVFDVTSWRVPRSNQEGRQDFPSWISLSVPRYKEKQEKDI